MLKVYGIYVIINIVVYFFQVGVFRYLFGYYDDYSIYAQEWYTGIDFSREENILGTPFDATDFSSFTILVSWIICSIFIILKLKKKLSKLDTTSSKILNILLAILLIVIMLKQGRFLIGIFMHF